MIILGIDPGTIKAGYGLVKVVGYNKLSYIHSGVISQSSKNSIVKRLGNILKQLEQIIDLYKPSVVALEKSFYAKNARTVIALGEARGVVLSVAGKNGLDVLEFSPNTVKQSVAGAGKADKNRVQKMVKMILNIKHDFKHNDESDALAIALCCYYRELSKVSS